MERSLPLFIVRGTQLNILSMSEGVQAQSGDKVILFSPAEEVDLSTMDDEAIFARLVLDAPVLDLPKGFAFKDIVQKAAAQLAQELPLSAEQLATGFLEGTRYGASLLTNSVALPHLTVPNIGHTKFLIVRCRDGISLDSQDIHYEGTAINEAMAGGVSALFFLVSPEEKPRLHLRILSQIVKAIDQDDFIMQWKMASDTIELRSVLMPKG